jgi:hypothetical protein
MPTVTNMPESQSDERNAELLEMPKSILPEDGCIIVTGRTGSGKTVAAQNLMRHYRHKMDIVVVMCGSVDTCKEYCEFVPSAFVHYISKFGKAEKALLQSWYDKMEQLRATGQPVRMMIIFDDLAFMKGSINKDETVTKILYNGRHAGILFIWLQQYVLNSGPDLRNQNKLVLATYDKVPENQERLFSAFNPCFKNNAAGFRDFVVVYEKCTEDFGLMVLNNQQSRSKKIQDNVFYYNPEFPVPKFKMMQKNALAWEYDEVKKNQEKKFVKTSTPVSGTHGLVVTKLQTKKQAKRKRDESDSESDDTPRKKRRSVTKRKRDESNDNRQKKRRSTPEYVTIQ